MSAAPHKPPPDAAWLKAVRRLHAIAAKRGLGHDDLHGVCGCTHLHELDAAELNRHATRLEDDHRGARASRPQRHLPRLAPGTIRPATDAQRRKIHYLLRELGWSPDTCTHWLWARHLIGNVDTTPMSTTTAHKCITELENAAKKSGRGLAAFSPGTSVPVPCEKDACPRTSEVPF